MNQRFYPNYHKTLGDFLTNTGGLLFVDIIKIPVRNRKYQYGTGAKTDFKPQFLKQSCFKQEKSGLVCGKLD